MLVWFHTTPHGGGVPSGVDQLHPQGEPVGRPRGDARCRQPGDRLGRMDAVIHNAGIYIGPHDLPVNVVAPYLLTMLIDRPSGWSTSAAATTAAGDPA
jgi:hypothetical protein